MEGNKKLDQSTHSILENSQFLYRDSLPPKSDYQKYKDELINYENQNYNYNNNNQNNNELNNLNLNNDNQFHFKYSGHFQDDENNIINDNDSIYTFGSKDINNLSSPNTNENCIIKQKEQNINQEALIYQDNKVFDSTNLEQGNNMNNVNITKENHLITNYSYVAFANNYGDNSCYVNVILHLIFNITDLNNIFKDLYKIDEMKKENPKQYMNTTSNSNIINNNNQNSNISSDPNENLGLSNKNIENKKTQDLNELFIVIGEILADYEMYSNSENTVQQVTILDSKNMRKCLEKLSNGLFTMNHVADPVELFIYILDNLNVHYQREIHSNFHLELIDKTVCGSRCPSSTKNKYDKDNFLYQIYVEELTNYIRDNAIKFKNSKGDLFHLSYSLYSDNKKECQICSLLMEKYLLCLNSPKYLLINCVWKSQVPEIKEIIEFLFLLSVEEDLNNLFICQLRTKNEDTNYNLLGIILFSYTLCHYTVLIFNKKEKVYALYNDNTVREFKTLYELFPEILIDSVNKYDNDKGYFYPVMLIYTKEKIYDKDDIINNSLNEVQYVELINKIEENQINFIQNHTLTEEQKKQNLEILIEKQKAYEQEILKKKADDNNENQKNDIVNIQNNFNDINNINIINDNLNNNLNELNNNNINDISNINDMSMSRIYDANNINDINENNINDISSNDIRKTINSVRKNDYNENNISTINNNNDINHLINNLGQKNTNNNVVNIEDNNNKIDVINYNFEDDKKLKNQNQIININEDKEINITNNDYYNIYGIDLLQNKNNTQEYKNYFNELDNLNINEIIDEKNKNNNIIDKNAPNDYLKNIHEQSNSNINKNLVNSQILNLNNNNYFNKDLDKIENNRLAQSLAIPPTKYFEEVNQNNINLNKDTNNININTINNKQKIITQIGDNINQNKNSNILSNSQRLNINNYLILDNQQNAINNKQNNLSNSVYDISYSNRPNLSNTQTNIKRSSNNNFQNKNLSNIQYEISNSNKLNLENTPISNIKTSSNNNIQNNLYNSKYIISNSNRQNLSNTQINIQESSNNIIQNNNLSYSYYDISNSSRPNLSNTQTNLKPNKNNNVQSNIISYNYYDINNINQPNLSNTQINLKQNINNNIQNKNISYIYDNINRQNLSNSKIYLKQSNNNKNTIQNNTTLIKQNDINIPNLINNQIIIKTNDNDNINQYTNLSNTYYDINNFNLQYLSNTQDNIKSNSNNNIQNIYLTSSQYDINSPNRLILLNTTPINTNISSNNNSNKIINEVNNQDSRVVVSMNFNPNLSNQQYYSNIPSQEYNQITAGTSINNMPIFIQSQYDSYNRPILINNQNNSGNSGGYIISNLSQSHPL